MSSDVVVVGAGIFGACAALELRRRGAEVTLLDPGPLPHPDAASSDISKLIRLDYGSDVFYTQLMEAALATWRTWNEAWAATLFHETGILVLSSQPMTPSSFEGSSFALLGARGHRLERLSASAIVERFPAWAPGRFADGYFNPQGGFAESGRVVAALLEQAAQSGVTIERNARVLPLPTREAKVDHVLTEAGARFAAGTVVIAGGAFTPSLVPELADRLVAVGQPVFHFELPASPALSPPAFVPWAADIASTGWYGFTAHEGVFKIANHGPGRRVDPRAERAVDAAKETMFRAFLRDALPSLSDARVVRTRLCLYCDSFDGDFLIDRHPTREGLVIASGGSGHAFKFAPALGVVAADAVFGIESPARARFRYREASAARFEHARFSGPS